MKNYQFAKLDMYSSVLKGLKENQSVWQGLSYFAARVAKLDTNIKDINTAASVQNTPTKSTTEVKTRCRKELQTSAMLVVRLMRSYADTTNNTVLFDEMHYTASGLRTSSAANLLLATSTIHTLSVQNLTGATNYGLTQAFLDDLLAKRAAFSASVNGPVSKRNIKKEATATLKRLFSETDVLLANQIDNDMSIYEDSHRAFYVAHFNLRAIMDSPTTKLAMRCKIVDADTGMPLPGARVVIKDHRIKRKSSPKGQLLVRNLKEGNHTVSVSLAGYAPQAVKVTHSAGETNFVNVELKRDRVE